MNEQFESALTTAATNLGITHREAFDSLMQMSMLEILDNLACCTNAQFESGSTEILRFEINPKIDDTNRHNLNQAFTILQQTMIASKPFQDVIGSYYEARFLETRNPADQLATPVRVAELVSNLKNDSDKFPVIRQFPDFGCRTAGQTMSFLRQVFNKYGNHKLLNRIVVISDTDKSLLMIAVYQIMFNCMRFDMRIGDFAAINFNMMNGFDGYDNHVVWSVNAKTGIQRELAKLNKWASSTTETPEKTKAA